MEAYMPLETEQSEGGPLTGALMRGLMRPGFDAWGYPINDGLGMGGGMNNMGGGMNNMGFGMGGRGSQGGSGSGSEGGRGGSGGENTAGESQSSRDGSSFGGGRFGGGLNRGGWGNPFANMFGGGGFFWRRK